MKPMQNRILRYVLYALLVPAVVYVVAGVGGRIMAGELETIPRIWGVAILLLVLTGILLIYWRPTRVYWRRLRKRLHRSGYQPDRRPRAVTSALLRGSQIDDDLYVEAGEIWLRELEHYSILWGTYMTSGEHLRHGVFVAAVYPSIPWSAETRQWPSSQSHPQDGEKRDPIREALASMRGFSFSFRGNALVGKLESTPIEGGLASTPKPAAVIRYFEQLAAALLMQRNTHS